MTKRYSVECFSLPIAFCNFAQKLMGELLDLELPHSNRVLYCLAIIANVFLGKWEYSPLMKHRPWGIRWNKKRKAFGFDYHFDEVKDTATKMVRRSLSQKV